MRTPLRMCITCSTRQPPEKMIRVVRMNNQVVFVAPEQKTVHGRSAYLCSSKECITKALDRKGKDAVSYALKMTIPPEVQSALRAYS